jgi:hypothetical protein
MLYFYNLWSTLFQSHLIFQSLLAQVWNQMRNFLMLMLPIRFLTLTYGM